MNAEKKRTKEQTPSFMTYVIRSIMDKDRFKLRIFLFLIGILVGAYIMK